jgi:hypothetical protein
MGRSDERFARGARGVVGSGNPTPALSAIAAFLGAPSFPAGYAG